MRRIAFLALIALTIIAMIYVVMLSRQANREALDAAPPIAPQSEVAGSGTVKTGGDYADDWQSQCGPLTDAKAQAACTAHLDAAYGHQSGAPVPSAKGSGGR